MQFKMLEFSRENSRLLNYYPVLPFKCRFLQVILG